MTPIISVRNLRKTFVQDIGRATSVKAFLVDVCRRRRRQIHSVKVLDDVSFDIFPGEIVGIMGRNGTGKSTLFRLLSKIYHPDSGEVIVRGKCLPLVGLGAGFHPELTGYENIYLNASIIGVGRAEINRVIDQIVEFSELGDQVHMPVKHFSSGMVLRLGFSIATHVNASILLLDEILGVGDEGFQRKSLKKLTELLGSGRTIILVTHDANAVREHCSRCIVMDAGKILYDGNAEGGIQRYSSLFAGA